MNEFIVRAMPVQGLSRRFRAGRPWGKEAVRVRVTDHPKPSSIERDRDGNKVVIYSNEITPAELELLRADPHFAVAPAGPANGEHEAIALNAAKVRALELEAELKEARKELAGAAEELKIAREQSLAEAREHGDRIARLEGDLASARAALKERLDREVTAVESGPAGAPQAAPREERAVADAPTQPAPGSRKKAGA